MTKQIVYRFFSAKTAPMYIFVVQESYGANSYLKFVADDSGLAFTWTSDPQEATKFDSKYAAKERVRDIDGLPATPCFKEL